MAEIAAPTPDDEQQSQPAAEASVGDAADQAPALEPISDQAPIAEDSPEPPAAEAAATPDGSAAAPVEPAATPVETEATPAAIVEPEVAAAPPAEPAPVAAAIPEPEPMVPAPVAEPEVIAAPAIASTIDVPASPTAVAEGEGGEWALLQAKVSAWLNSGQLQQQWQAARQPLSLLAGLIALLLVLRIYSALLGVLDSLPLIPGLLELVGVIVVVRFSLTRLVRSDERSSLIQGLQQRWKAFRGKG